MKSLLVRAFGKALVWLGLNDPAENRLHASHGWLLPPLPARLTPAPATKPAPARARD